MTMDYMYQGEITLEKDLGEIVYAQVSFIAEETVFSVSRRSMREDGFNYDDSIEYYSGMEALDNYSEDDDIDNYTAALKASSISAYFPYFLKLDYLTDAQVDESFANKLEAYDTKNSKECIRYGATYDSDCKYIQCVEVFNTVQPEYNEYYQIIRLGNGQYRFTASHSSYFAGIILDNDIYKNEFKIDYNPDFFIDVTSIDDIPTEHSYSKITFENLRVIVIAQSFYDEKADVTKDELITAKQEFDTHARNRMNHK